MPTSSPAERDEPAYLEQEIADGLAAVTAAAQELGTPGEPVACRDIGRVFDTAIEHGASIWNRGSQVGCARIYLHAAHAILGQLQPPGRLTALPSGDPGGVLEALQRVADACPTATLSNANKLGWALRGIFDNFHVARGIEDVDQLIDATRAGGGAVDADLVSLCLTVAIAHGNFLYQTEAVDACAVLHRHTARRVLNLLAEQERTGSLSPALDRVRHELAPIVAAHPRITEANAAGLAWKLYEAFLRIIRLAPTDADRQTASEYQGFISYRRDGGADTARVVRAYLQMRGLNTFLDVEGLDGGEFGPHLLQAIEQSPSFLLILTPGSLNRCEHPNDWLRAEIAHAIRTRRTIIPVLKDGFQFPAPDSLPPEIRPLGGFNAVTYSHEFFDAVIERIERYMRSATGEADR